MHRDMAHEQDPLRRPSSSSSGPLSSYPPPSPARFVRHPLLNASDTKKPASFPSNSTTTDSTTLTNNRHDLTTLDITDLMTSDDSHSDASTLRSKGFQDAGDDDDDSESEHPLLEKCVQSPESTNSLALKPSVSSASTLVNGRTGYPPHKPVPATQVFARGASPLHLPKLDAYLASLPKPPFSSKKTSSKPSMFAPMDRLAKSAMSLEDLEMNFQIPPWWRNRKTLLGSAVNLVIGLTVSDPFFVANDLVLTWSFRVPVQLQHTTAYKVS